MKKRTPKQEKEFQEQLKKDQRRFAISQRYSIVRDAEFLTVYAANRLRGSFQYYDCSQNPDFDDLHHHVYRALSFIEFALEELAEIRDRDYELGATPEQISKEVHRGRRKRNDSKGRKEGRKNKNRRLQDSSKRK